MILQHRSPMLFSVLQRTLAALVAGACLSGACVSGAYAAPTVPQVVQGQATFAQQGNVFSITNSPNAVINWQSFSINAGEITRFIQQSGDSAVLNRIVGHDPSKILGALQSNGHVFLINPNGILFGREARVDVNGLTASTLALSDADFLSGKKHFRGAAGAGGIVNQGSITTATGGQVFLIATNVENSGLITSPQGQVVLAAGHTVQLVDSSNPSLHVVVSAPADHAINLGQVIAQGGKVGIFGALVNQRGVLNANSAHLGANGKIVLRASGDTMLGAGSVTSATGAGSGGQVTVEGTRVGMTGNAMIDVSGATGGGSVLFGGGYQGQNPLMRNARQTLLGQNASIRADAVKSGNGGTVVLWGDASTRAQGRISARGGALGGNGGLVETSGHYLDVNGIVVQAGAAKGNNGTWLLDPYDIEVGLSGGSATLADVDQFTDPLSVARINADTLTSVLPGTNIVLQATNDVTFNTPVNAVLGTGSLTVDAGNSIYVNAPISTAGGAVTMTANHPAYASGTGAIVVSGDGALHTGGGNVSLNATEVTLGGVLTTGNGNVTINGGNRVWFEQNLDTGNGNLDVAAREILFGGAGTSATTGTGAMTFNTQGGIFTLGYNWLLSSAGEINVHADAVTLAGNMGGVGMLRPNVSFTTYTAGRGIDMVSGGMDGAPNLRLAPERLAAFDAATLTIGNRAYNGDINVLSAYDVGLARKLTLNTQANINVYQPITMPSAIGSELELLIDGAFPSGSITTWADPLAPGVEPGGRLVADTVTLQANNMNIGASIASIATLAPGGGNVVLTPQTAMGRISIGAGAVDGADMLGLQDTELNFISTKGLRIGGNAGQMGGLNVTAAGMDFTSILGTDGKLRLNGGQGNLTLDGNLVAPDALYLEGKHLETGGMASAKAASVQLNASFGIGSASSAFNTESSHLSAVNDIANGMAPINIANTGELTLGNVHQSGSGNQGGITIANAGGMTLLASDPAGMAAASISTAGTGGIVLRTQSPLSIYGNIGSENGAIELEAGNGGELTIGANAAVSSVAGNIGLTAGSLVNNGSVHTSAGNINVAAPTVAGSGTFTAPGGMVSGLPAVIPSLSACLADRARAGCTEVLKVALDACVVDPSGSDCGAVLPPMAICVANSATYGCSVVLPSVQQCIADPAALGCSVVLPTLAACTAEPSTAGCSVVLPTLAACTAAPPTAGCSVVLPSLAACTAEPSTAGCSVVLPTLAACTAAPSTAGCSAVLPTLTTCTAAPSTPGCSVVLPTLATCTAAPSTAGCSVVLPTLKACTAAPATAGCSAVLPTLKTCTSAPSTEGCSAVLPTLTVCTAAPSTPGCSVVLPTLTACIAAPSTPGCSVVLPTLTICTAAPSTAGCSAVLPTLKVCTSAPSIPGCSVVLPTVTTCTAAPSTPGCSVVLPTLTECTAAPSTAGCSAVLPTLTTCTLAPSSAGCSVVLPSLSACTAAPSTAGCSVVLPSLSACTAAPSTDGCAAVLPSMSMCTTTPSMVGCAVVLPSLSACTSAPTTAGCSVVLPSLSACTTAPSTAGCATVLPSLSECSAAPSTAGCSAVLPLLSACTAAPSTAGCSAVLPSLSACTTLPSSPGCVAVLPTANACMANPAMAGCTSVLPPLAACVANPSLPACSAVLPTLSACTASPHSQGCSVVLPTLAQCVDSPTLQGCSAVLPTLVACAKAPQSAGCAVVTKPALAEPNKAVAAALETTINTVDKSNQAARLDDEKKDNKDDSTQAGASTVQGEKKNELVKKTYCN